MRDMPLYDAHVPEYALDVGKLVWHRLHEWIIADQPAGLPVVDDQNPVVVGDVDRHEDVPDLRQQVEHGGGELGDRGRVVWMPVRWGLSGVQQGAELRPRCEGI